MAESKHATPIPSPLVEFLLLGPTYDRRQLQDSPILGDVWVEFGKTPAGVIDLLIAPYRGQPAGAVAAAIDADLGEKRYGEVSYLQGLIAAKLSFTDLLQIVLPKTKWWFDKQAQPLPTQTKAVKRGRHVFREMVAPVHEVGGYIENPATVRRVLETVIASASAWHQKIVSARGDQVSGLDRFVALVSLILWAGDNRTNSSRDYPASADEQISYILREIKIERAAELVAQVGKRLSEKAALEPLVWQVSLNRRPMLAMTRSIPAVKADAAKTLFKVDCSGIGWAVLDSGIDGRHPAFYNSDGTDVRIRRSFDFRNIRKIITLSNRTLKTRQKNGAELVGSAEAPLLQPPIDPESDLATLAEDARNRGPLRWDLAERFVEICPDAKPPANHGTHVAGIIGANKAGALQHSRDPGNEFADGMCPDISLYDFRVIGRTMQDTEFAIIAALQFIRYLNERDNLPSIHGANLSLSIAHDVRNFACGRTPVCEECERLVESGVVVVAAAGNHGYQTFQTKDGAYEGYAAFSITDPGNADGVLTVGATHRFWPHTYGISFFSSRGPTGDGRLKPDLVAPGERIRGPLPGGEWGDLDGTSMAAPHVSGAAAMLMGRYSELIGRPRRIKQILCDTATDLGRERTFQGRGMLDVLRAFQSI